MPKIRTTCFLFSTQIGRFMEMIGMPALHERTLLERSRLCHGEGRAGGKSCGEGFLDRGTELRGRKYCASCGRGHIGT
ncbi:hypothetical protein ACHAWF_000624 [Thalassiosira exigua]